MESDDVSGVFEFPLQDLTLDDNKMHWREDRLQGETARTDVKGVLEWEIDQFPRAPDRAKGDSGQTLWTQGTAIARRNKLATRSRFKRHKYRARPRSAIGNTGYYNPSVHYSRGQ